MTCFEVKDIMADINDLVVDSNNEKVCKSSTIIRFCDYINNSPVTQADCTDDELAALQTETDDLGDNIEAFHKTVQDEIVVEIVTEMARIEEAMKNYSLILEERKKQELIAFEVYNSNYFERFCI